ncbi:MAG: NTP transferase domain-containing protein [Deltaproteobacteria bacterium]|nr:NTP transferase domain-containing protein [Deltaproteobacteria bacterium]
MPGSAPSLFTILLAGGRSRRTGELLGPKGLVELRGVPFLLRQVQALRTLGLMPVVVTGFHHEAYAGALAGAAARIVRNPDPDRGPFSSLQCGLELCLKDRGFSGGLFVLPLDVPVPSGRVFEILREGGGGTHAAIPTHQGRGGHPVWLPRPIAENLLAVADGPDARLDRQLSAWAGRGAVRRLAVPDGDVLLDLNTEGAWRAYLDLHD